MSVEQNPACVRLVELLERVYLQGGMLRTTARRKEQVHSKLCSMHRSYMEQQVVYQVLAGALQSVSGQPEGEWLAWAEVQHCLGGVAPGDSLLGVEPSHVRAAQQRETLTKRIPPELEQRLRSKCKRTVEWYEGHKATGSEELQLAKAGQLPQLVAQQLQELKAREEHFRSRKREQANRVGIRHKVLVDSCQELQQVLEQHKLAIQVEAEQVIVDHLHTQCRAMLGKLEVMQYQLLKGVCSEGRIQALRELRSHLMHACSSGEEHLLQTRQALQHYKSFGESFARLAREYQELLVETENKQWALSELGKSDAS